MDKEKGVGRVGLCCPFHDELYRPLLLTQTLPSILGGEEQAHSSATSKVLWDAGDASLGHLLEFQATRFLLL